MHPNPDQRTATSPCPRPAWLVLTLGTLLGCGGSEEGLEDGPPAEVLAEIPPETRPLEELPLGSLFDRPVPVRPAIERNLPFHDPHADGWASEAWSRATEKLLDEAVLAVLRGEPVPDGVLAESFEGASALLGELEPLDAQGNYLSEVGAGPDDWRADAGEPLSADLAAQLTAGTEGLGTPRGVWTEVERMRPSEGSEPETADARVRLRIAWDREGGAVQYNGAWSAHLVIEDGAPRIVRLRRHSSELASAAAPLLVDVTGFAFAGTACFEDEYLRDPENYYFQSDRLTEYDIFGNYGMAIGDVNDDGYEDVYTCTAAGMPNRLFLRNPDGTVREASEEWNVGFLDTTRSAVIADLDGDGHRDLAVALGSRVVVAWNDGTRFGERTVLSSGGADDVYGISVADPDGDGDVDLYACCYGVGVVREGSRGPARVLSNVPTPYYDATNGASNVYWRNDGPRRFTDATAESGLMQNNDKFSFSSIWEDLDGDGDLDLYVANDFGRNHLYRNEGGHFVDVAGPGGADDRANGMGPSCADFDLDGDIDINVSNIHAPEGMRITDLAVMRGSHGRGDALLHSQPLARGNTLLRNRGDGTFENVADAYGVNRCGWAWGARFLDLDNDMYEDLYSPNGWFTRQGTEDVNEFFWRFVIAQSPPEGKPTPTYSIAMTTIEHIALEQGHTWAGGEYSVMLMNQGGERFVDTTALVAPHRPTDGRAVAGLDWDRDGCIDLVLKNRDAPRVQLLHNRNPEAVAGNWLVVELRNEAPNRDAIGARIELHAGGKVQRRTIYAGDGFISQTPRRQHFGLEGHAPEALVVRWPDGTVERHPGGEAPGAGLEANRAYVIERGAEAPVELPWEPLEGFHELPHEPLDKLEDRLRRVVLFDELPMGPFPLPSFDDGARTVSDFSGAPLLVTLWSQAGEACEGQLMRLARERERLEAAGLRAVPITIDEGPELAAARRTTQQLGFAETGGYADGRLMLAFEVVLGDVLPRTGNIAMPCNLLFDARGELCVIYQGPVRVDVVLEDLVALGRRGERSAGEALSGGLWIDPPSRAFATLAKTMDELGRSELSRFYAECAEAR